MAAKHKSQAFTLAKEARTFKMKISLEKAMAKRSQTKITTEVNKLEAELAELRAARRELEECGITRLTELENL